MTNKVFLSVGRTFTPAQERFVAEFEQHLRAIGLTPQTVGRNYYKNQQPLRSVTECMHQCVGAAILAFERIHIDEGQERRGGPDAAALRSVNVPTVWNQIEAAMAYTLDKPLLVLIEHGLRSEGLLEKGYDWFVKWVTLDRPAFSDPEFVGLVADWKERMLARATSTARVAEEQSPKADLGGMTIGDLLSRLRPAQLWATVAALGAILVAVASVAYQIGTLAAPRS